MQFTNSGGVKDACITQLAVNRFSSCPSFTPQIYNPWGILRNIVFFACSSSNGATINCVKYHNLVYQGLTTMAAAPESQQRSTRKPAQTGYYNHCPESQLAE
jgi:hypothetical protein